MGRLKWIVPLILAAGLAFWVLREDLRLPWYKVYRYEKENPGCAAGLISPDYPNLKLPTAFLSFFMAWGDGFPAAEVTRARVPKAVLVLTWEPYLKNEPGRSLLDEIAAGRHDAYMRRLAEAIKAYGRPVLLRWGHEPNGDWYSWSGAKNGRDPARYISAWRRMAGIIRAGAGPEARLVFSVNGADKPAEDWNRFENYYPGHEYADAVGLDIYNWGTTKEWSSWQRPIQLLADPYARALSMAPDKPLFVTETAACPKGGSKAQWLLRLFYRLESRYTAVKGFMWFDYDKECDWRLSSDAAAAAVYTAGLDGAHFSADGGGLDWFFKEGGK